jgi:hypothetical protein
MPDNWEASEEELLHSREKAKEQRLRSKRSNILGCLIPAMVFLVLFGGVCGPNLLLDYELDRYRDDAIKSLQAIGKAEIEYKDSIGNGTYGALEDLVDAGYNINDFKKGSFESRYKLELYANTYSMSFDENPNPVLASTFTAVAFPRHDDNAGQLMWTFSIREDQVVRKYSGPPLSFRAWGQDGDYGARSWEPVR